MRIVSVMATVALALTAYVGNPSKSDSRFGNSFGAGLNAGRVAGR